MNRVLAFLYGALCYVLFFITILYSIGFVGNLVVPKSIDSGVAGPYARAILVDIVLLAIFAVQHSVMARPAFKRWWTQFIPAAIERSTYVLLSSLALLLLFWLWQPMPEVIWDVDNTAGKYALWGVFAAGWVLVFISTFLISHFDLFGLRQVYLHLKERPYTPPPFKDPLLYRIVRHPIMLGFLIAFWATPHMTVGHLLFAIGTTAYILFALQLEERDLVAEHGDTYIDYRKRVSMIIPVPGKKRN